MDAGPEFEDLDRNLGMIEPVDEKNMKDEGEGERENLFGTVTPVPFPDLNAVLKHSKTS
jgi:hypothetical protein